MDQYNIAELLEVAFGVSSYQTPTNADEGARMSWLGTPILYPITFKEKNYKVFTKHGDVVLKHFNNFELPATTLLSFKRSKIITKTNARASSGSVKELFGFNDWNIDIRGLCLADPSHENAKTAIEQKIKLKEFDEIVDSIQVVNDLFNNLDISHLIIEDISFNQLKGKPGVIPFHLKCSSDEPIEMYL